jgi:Uma2 family endonuclease
VFLAEEMTMSVTTNWTDICEDPVLQELPYKIQTDKWGNIVMSPATNEHGMYQAKIVSLLSRFMSTGVIISECSVQTSEGVKVADVAWASDTFMQRNRGSNPFLEAPELCVEILSPSNTLQEMEEKKELYFARGAQEFWVCDRSGRMTFSQNTGVLPTSRLFGAFPLTFEI